MAYPGTGLASDDPRPLRDQVYDILRDWIFDGRLAPGSRINERIVSEELEVSRVPVREAIRMLQVNGLVSPSNRRGVIVRTLEPRDIDELFALRKILEKFEAELAANSDNQQLKRHLKYLMAESEESYRNHQHDRFMDLNQEVHAAISELADNRQLAEVLGHLAGRLRWNPAQNSDPERILREHEALADAIIAGDPEAAGRTAVDHVEARHLTLLASLFGDESSKATDDQRIVTL